MLTLTGAETPLSGRISTVPSMRGWRLHVSVRVVVSQVGSLPKSQRCQDSPLESLYLVYP